VKNTKESDFDFLKRLSQRIYYDFFIFNWTLYFRKPAVSEEPSVTLEWGKSLISFSPEIDIAPIVPGIAVKSHNTDNNQDIVGIATNKSEVDEDQRKELPILESIPEPLQILSESILKIFGILGKSQDLISRIDVVTDSVSSERDAKNLAKALLQKKNENYLKGTGESIGIPEILAGKNIKLEGLGAKFSNTYYVEKANHTINSSGYKTTFSVKYMGLNTDDKIDLRSISRQPVSASNSSDSSDSSDSSSVNPNDNLQF
jgi:phage protein D